MKTLASISLDLDNKWSYLKTHGDSGWASFPSYLDVLIPRVLSFLKQRNLKITFFIVGQDAVLDENSKLLRMIADAGHEIGNHSFHHEPWLHQYSDEEIDEEISKATRVIEKVTGKRPVGFRGPGFSLSEGTLKSLIKQGYKYDCTTFPNFLNPVARAYYLMTSNLDAEEKKKRSQLFGSWKDGLRPLKPYIWQLNEKKLLEIPVTTMPVFKVPIHFSYVLYLFTFSPLIAKTYFNIAMMMCKLTKTEPSLLLHPLDFLGKDDAADLSFFPAMKVSSERKMEFMGELMDSLVAKFNIVPVGEHANLIGKRDGIRLLIPNFNTDV